MISTLQAKRKDLSGIISFLESVRGDTSEISFNQFIVAKDDDKLIGCVRIKEMADDCLELASLVVLEEYRGKGIGSKLIKEILKKEKRRPIYLLCFMERKNFYSNLGFTLIEKESLPDVLKKEYERVFDNLKKLNKEILSMVCN